MTDLRSWVSAGLAVAFFGVQVARLSTNPTYAFYTSWSFTLVLLFLAGDALAATRAWAGTYMLPVIVASTTFVALATVSASPLHPRRSNTATDPRLHRG